MIDGEESRVLAAVDGGGVAWARLKLEVEHGEVVVLSVGGGVWVGWCCLFISFRIIFFLCSNEEKKTHDGQSRLNQIKNIAVLSRACVQDRYGQTHPLWFDLCWAVPLD